MPNEPISKISGSAPFMQTWQDKANEVIDAENKLLRVQIKIVQVGGSRLDIGSDIATLYICTKDIAFAVTGSRGSNVALKSLITALKGIFNVSDTTT